MPSIYRVYCENCDKASASRFPAEVVGYVAFDKENNGELLAEHYLTLALDDRIESIPHPCEDSRLKNLGYSYEKAVAEGRLITNEPVICDRCGTINIKRGLATDARRACTMVVLIFLSILSYALSWKKTGLCFGVLSLVVLAYHLMTLGINRFRFRKRIEELGLKECKNCQGNRFSSLKSGARLFPCPRCKQTSLVVRVAGIS